jgi:hypothetical protein
MRVILNDKKFVKQMNNIVNYSFGFIEGIQKGKTVFLNNLGKETVEALRMFVDANAKLDPMSMHHVYEWGKVGMSSKRLFEVTNTVSNL